MKRALWKSCLMGAGLAVVSACTPTTHDAVTTTGGAPQLFTLEPAQDRAVLQRTADSYLATLLAAPANEQVTLIKVNPAVVSRDTQELAVTLPDGKTARFHLRDFTTITPGIEGWIGYKPSDLTQAQAAASSEIDIDPRYYLSIVREGDKLVGSLVVDGQLYQLDHVGPGRNALIKVDESKLPAHGKPLVPNHGGDRAGRQAQSAHSTIRVLFVTTNQSRATRPNNRAELAKALNDANQYMRNSDVAITFELAGYYDADYDETGRTYSQQLDDIRLARPFGADVLKVRETLRADLVSMYSTATQFCGMAWLSSPKVQAHSVVSCAGSLAHELGHNLGVNHGWNPGDKVSNPPYMHGYRSTVAPAFHTQMVTSHGALPYFSNPRLRYQGSAMGTVEHHDAARRLNERRETVENFYPPATNLVTIEVFSETNFQGNSCYMSVEYPGAQQVSPSGSACKGKVTIPRSARIRNLAPERALCWRSAGSYLGCYSAAEAGDFEHANLNSVSGLPSHIKYSYYGQALPLEVYHGPW
ncbi:MAG TPA: M12 family metallo-peptidase [Pseudomonas sp.]|uniref:zinc-dependent metalloprotease family protein n=1 Tax=Pseudomonas sp. TaxID=306 RepID=UPI002B48BE30|nr:M12 family metallo-peptidase [Pseudomonas sp.]HKS13078.1 M12 family metallo-peptidase [Pseudomonas sp.]